MSEWDIEKKIPPPQNKRLPGTAAEVVVEVVEDDDSRTAHSYRTAAKNSSLVLYCNNRKTPI